MNNKCFIITRSPTLVADEATRSFYSPTKTIRVKERLRVLDPLTVYLYRLHCFRAVFSLFLAIRAPKCLL